MKYFLLFDGLICAICFFKNYLIFKFFNTNSNFEKIIEDYNKIYTIVFYNRYLFYTLIYFSTFFLPFNEIFLLLTFPYIQNLLLSINKVNNLYKLLINYQYIFVKYSFSKLLVHFIQQLHSKIDLVQNFNIFIIYTKIKLDFSVLKTIIFIIFMHILRNTNYYYYKTIKMAYYYQNNYAFEILTEENALKIINLINKERNWENLTNINELNALYTLIINKYFLNYKNTFQFQLIIFYSLWSFISLLKLLQFGIILVILTIYLKFDSYKILNNYKLITNTILTSYLIYFNINDLIISMIIISNKFIYIFFDEIYFFIKNIKNIIILIKKYEKKYKSL